MESSLDKRNVQRKRRTLRVRGQVRGNAERPRLSVVRSNRHISVQVIDDASGVTLFGLSTRSKEMASLQLDRKSKESARVLGEKVAERAKEKNISTVVFDRGCRKYHGLLAELANAARTAGLQF